MKERVSTIIGKTPIILVAPHGPDDTNTDILTERVANQLNCFAVINRGFERADCVDVINDKADCNRIDHAKKEIVFEEFFKPILKFKDRLTQNSIKMMVPSSFLPINSKRSKPDPATIFYIHGCGNIVHKETQQLVSLIVGYGLGTKKDSITCDLWRKNLFVDLYDKTIADRNLTSNYGKVFEGRGGGRYAGRDSNNLNQYFRKHDPDRNIHSLQLEFPFSVRSNEKVLDDTVCFLAHSIKEYMHYEGYDAEPNPRFI